MYVVLIPGPEPRQVRAVGGIDPSEAVWEGLDIEPLTWQEADAMPQKIGVLHFDAVERVWSIEAAI